MSDDNLTKCSRCQFKQVDYTDSQSIWCGMHQDYFEHDDNCSDFSQPKTRENYLVNLLSTYRNIVENSKG